MMPCPPGSDAGAVLAVGGGQKPRFPRAARRRRRCWSCPYPPPRAHRAKARSTACTTTSSATIASAPLIDEDGLLEWANVFNNAYGTPRAAIEKALSEGRNVLFDIDWQGTQQLRQKMPQDLVSVFVLPPSLAALETG